MSPGIPATKRSIQGLSVSNGLHENPPTRREKRRKQQANRRKIIHLSRIRSLPGSYIENDQSDELRKNRARRKLNEAMRISNANLMSISDFTELITNAEAWKLSLPSDAKRAVQADWDFIEELEAKKQRPIQNTAVPHKTSARIR